MSGTEHIVVDSSVIVASFLDFQDFHQRGRTYVNQLIDGRCIFHLPMIVVVEVTSAIRRQTQRRWRPLLEIWDENVADWEHDGKLVLYPLDRPRMDNAIEIARRDRLAGADSVIAALAEELNFLLKTFDTRILARFQRASV